QIKEYALSEDIPVVGEIPFDETVIASINSLTPITSYPKSPAAAEIKNMWENLKELIESLKASG
ncbi:MAG TPA: (4Fe-4S)-binding protein, partial [Clostridia bacterium]|nr:(4Fe-4S)-binding protein [Clostridia bacterium]